MIFFFFLTRSKAKQSETISKNRLWTRLRLSRMGERERARERECMWVRVCACVWYSLWLLSWLLFFGLCYCVLLFALCALLCGPWQPYDDGDDNDNSTTTTTTTIIMITDARNTFKALPLALPPSLSSNSTRYQLYMHIYILKPLYVCLVSITLPIDKPRQTTRW